MTPDLYDLDAKLVIHPTAEDVLRAHWQPVLIAEGVPADEWIDGTLVGTTDDGERADLSMTDAIAEMEENGLWGWCDTKNRTVHVWTRPRDSSEAITELVHLLAHELAHVADTHSPPDYQGDPEDAATFREEWRCELVASVAVTAYQWAHEVFMRAAVTAGRPA